MEALIEFMSLSDQLNDKEYKKFKLRAMKLLDRDQFQRALFLYSKDSPDAIAPFMKATTKIINARKPKPNNITTHDRLDLLPSPLIGKCASFLDMKQYHLFGRVSRKIYTASFSPCQLVKILFPTLPEKFGHRYSHAKCVAVANGYQSLENLKGLRHFSRMETLKMSNFNSSHVLTWMRQQQNKMKDWWPNLMAIDILQDSSVAMLLINALGEQLRSISLGTMCNLMICSAQLPNLETICANFESLKSFQRVVLELLQKVTIIWKDESGEEILNLMFSKNNAWQSVCIDVRKSTAVEIMDKIILHIGTMDGDHTLHPADIHFVGHVNCLGIGCGKLDALSRLAKLSCAMKSCCKAFKLTLEFDSGSYEHSLAEFVDGQFIARTKNVLNAWKDYRVEYKVTHDLLKIIISNK